QGGHQAADLEPDHDEALRHLQAERLVRATAQPGWLEVETYHDQIRKAVVEAMSPERQRKLHRALPEALANEQGSNPEVVALHAEAAGGLTELAAQYYEQAADLASKALAFERAALLYGKALDLGSAPPEKARQLHERRGNALANAGRGEEAA